MSYTWQNGEVITAEKLNNTGNIVMLPTTQDGLDVSFNEIVAFLQQGVLPVMIDSYEDGMDVLYLHAAYPLDGKYYAEFFTTVRGSLEIAASTVTADSPSEKMVWVGD